MELTPGTKEYIEKYRIVLATVALESFDKVYMQSIIPTLMSAVCSNYCMITASLLPMARNAALTKIYERDPDFTHILFVDADMQFNPHQILQLLSADKDVVSGLMVLRQPPHKIVNSFDEGEDLVRLVEQGIVKEVDAVGAAFTLIKKEVLDGVEEQTNTGPIWFTTDRSPRPGFEAEADIFTRNSLVYIENSDNDREVIKQKIAQAIAMGQQSHIGTSLCGEDIAFSVRARKFGFKLFVHCGCPIGHQGKQVYDVRDNAKENCESEHDHGLKLASV